MNYIQILENTVIPAIISSDEKDKRYEIVNTYVNSHLPNELYRFRTISERSLDQLYNDELGFSCCSSMNDDFDARISYNRNELYNWLNSFLKSDAKSILFEQYFRNSELIDRFKGIIPNFDMLYNKIINCTVEKFDSLLEELIKFLSNKLDAVLEMITADVQETVKIASFSKNIASDMMWGHYANNATGFAIGYSFNKNTIVFSNEDKNNIKSGMLFPIEYSNQRIDTTQYAKYLFQIRILRNVMISNGIIDDNGLINKVVQCPDEFMSAKLALFKSNNWKPEGEWRLFLTSNNPSMFYEKYPKVKYKPRAIYLGRKISSINEKIIVDIAKEKKLPVYKMKIDDSSRTYKLKSYII